MKLRKTLLGRQLIAGLVLLFGSGAASAVLIDFDSAALGPLGSLGGVNFTNTTVVNSVFSLSGSQSIISTSGGFDWLEADAVGGSFSQIVNMVSISGANVGFNGLQLNAYDKDGNLLGSDLGFGSTEGGTAPPNPPGDVVTLSVAAAGIASFTIFQDNANHFDTIVLDNLEYEVKVPEPMVIALFAVGLLGLSFARRGKV